ncbi:TPA: hypothetical protein ACJGSF_002807 [Salmonella enterica subsp. enterica serovar Muenchen]|nr:hypothetical protein [Salmonella enterica subsp. diarizonae]EEL9492700.1 hypothetical protein [Salmonella enterica subsp. enterica serovar Singapore]EGS6511013.1 hypothetical protein [Salmonella enterica]EEG1123639.1 hypothetical protein [Salmonella enterica subsp. diarizonae]EHI8953669.1 hypothetical protein [Salmonella enterica]
MSKGGTPVFLPAELAVIDMHKLGYGPYAGVQFVSDFDKKIIPKDGSIILALTKEMARNLGTALLEYAESVEDAPPKAH